MHTFNSDMACMYQMNYTHYTTYTSTPYTHTSTQTHVRTHTHTHTHTHYAHSPDRVVVTEVQGGDDLSEEPPGLFRSQPALLH